MYASLCPRRPKTQGYVSLIPVSPPVPCTHHPRSCCSKSTVELNDSTYWGYIQLENEKVDCSLFWKAVSFLCQKIIGSDHWQPAQSGSSQRAGTCPETLIMGFSPLDWESLVSKVSSRAYCGCWDWRWEACSEDVAAPDGLCLGALSSRSLT